MDISETQLHQQKQNPSNASGFCGEEKAAKIRKSLSPGSKRWLEKTKEDQPASKVPKPEVQPLGNTAGTPGPVSSLRMCHHRLPGRCGTSLPWDTTQGQ